MMKRLSEDRLIRSNVFFNLQDSRNSLYISRLEELAVYTVKLRNSLRYYIILVDNDDLSFGFVATRSYSYNEGDVLQVRLSFIRKGDDILSPTIGLVPVLRQPIKGYIRPAFKQILLHSCRSILIDLQSDGLDLGSLKSEFDSKAIFLEDFVENVDNAIQISIK